MAETVPTLKTAEATSSNETGVPSSATAASEEETNKGHQQPTTGKQTYSACTSISDNDLWNEANGKGVTTAVKIPEKKATTAAVEKQDLQLATAADGGAYVTTGISQLIALHREKER